MVCCVLETPQLRAEHPALASPEFAEFGQDPWRIFAGLLGDSGTVHVESTMGVEWADALRGHLGSESIVISDTIPFLARARKDEFEQALLREASTTAERAIAAGASVVQAGVDEQTVADAIRTQFESDLAGRATEVSPIVIGSQNHRAMHHVPSTDTLPAHGPVRLGILGRVDGYWVLLIRMMVVGHADQFERDYEIYLRIYEDTLAGLRRVLSQRTCTRVAGVALRLKGSS